MPEHGLFGAVAAGDDVDGAEYKGVKVHSLYGATRRPTPAMLDSIDSQPVTQRHRIKTDKARLFFTQQRPLHQSPNRVGTVKNDKLFAGFSTFFRG